VKKSFGIPCIDTRNLRYDGSGSVRQKLSPDDRSIRLTAYKGLVCPVIQLTTIRQDWKMKNRGRGKRSGLGMSTQNDLSRELGSVLWKKIAFRKKRKKVEPVLKPAPYDPEQSLERLLKKP